MQPSGNVKGGGYLTIFCRRDAETIAHGSDAGCHVTLACERDRGGMLVDPWGCSMFGGTSHGNAVDAHAFAVFSICFFILTFMPVLRILAQIL